MYRMDYSQALWIKALICGTVYEADRLKSLFVEGLEGCIRQNVRSHLAIHPESELSMLAKYNASVASLRRTEKKIDFSTILDRPKTTCKDGWNNLMSIESSSTESDRHDTGYSGSSMKVALLDSTYTSGAPQYDTSEFHFLVSVEKKYTGSTT